MRMRAPRGFTLIELLVVISVILVLAALVMPVIQSAVSQADRAKCVSNMAQIGKALVAYAAVYGRYLPFNRRASNGWPRHWYCANAYDEDGAPGGSLPQYDVLGRLYDTAMLADPVALFCPNDKRTIPPLEEWERRRTERGSDISCSYLYRGKPDPPYCFKLSDLDQHAIAREERLYLHGKPWIQVLYGDGSCGRHSNEQDKLKLDYYNNTLYEDWATIDAARR